MMGDAQKMISADYVSGYLFQLAALSVAKADIQGLWPINRPKPMI